MVNIKSSQFLFSTGDAALIMDYKSPLSVRKHFHNNNIGQQLDGLTKKPVIVLTETDMGRLVLYKHKSNNQPLEDVYPIIQNTYGIDLKEHSGNEGFQKLFMSYLSQNISSLLELEYMELVDYISQT